MDMNPAPVPPYSPEGVWPPPPVAAQPQAVPVCPFKWIYRRLPGPSGAKALITDIREGYLQFDPQGLVIQAQVIPRAQIRIPIMIGSFLIGGGVILAAAASYVMENAFRHDERVGILWKDIREVLLVPDKQQAGLIFDAPTHTGKVRTFCLVFTPAAGYYDFFAQNVQYYLTANVSEGRTRNATPLAVWIFLAVLLALLIGFVIYVSSQH